MRVLRVINYSNNRYKPCNNPIISPVLSENKMPLSMPKTDRFIKMPSFGALIHTHGEFRYLSKEHLIHCFYCKRPLLYGGTLHSFQDDGVFSGTVKEFVTKLKPYKKCLKHTQRAVFTQIEKYAQKAPQTHLSEIIQHLHSSSLRKLLKIQDSIIGKMTKEADKLPVDVRKNFRACMRKYHKRLHEIKYIETFSGKKYSYQVNKLKQSINNNSLKDYLERITIPLSDSIFKEDSKIVPPEIRSEILGRKITPEMTARELKLYVVSRVKRIGERLDRRDLVELSITAEKMIKGKPVVIHFSNKDLMYDLAEDILLPVRKSDVYYRIMDIANTLPSSNTSINSFIVKHKLSDSDTIGYKLFEPSITTVEHVKAKAKGGADDLENIVLACKLDNNMRASDDMSLFIQRFPSKNQQIYFDDIINITKSENVFTQAQVEGMSESVKNEGKVHVDLSKLYKEDK